MFGKNDSKKQDSKSFSDSKKIEEMMKKMNMNIKNVEALEVVIKTKDKNITISKPEVMIANIMGKDVYQITGQIKETSEEDIKLVMDKTGKDRETVEQTLEELDNDLAKAIIELKKK